MQTYAQLSKFCISAASFSVNSETFIRNHANTTNPGRTVFMSSSEQEQFVFPGEVLRGIPRLRTARGTGLTRILLALRERTARISGYLNREEESQIVDFLNDHNVDVVLTEFLNHATLTQRPIQKAGARHFVYVHGYDVHALATQLSWRMAYRRVFRQATGIICSSQYVRGVLQRLGAPLRKIFVAELGIDDRFFAPTVSFKAQKRVVLISRLIESKGIDFVLKAFAEVRSVVPQATLNIVGDGPERAKLIHLARKLGLSNYVTFHGMLTPSQVVEVLDQSTVFVQHSVTIPGIGKETFGLSVIEAMARGRPVIVSRHGGMTETVLEGETGLLVEERDVAQLSGAIIKVLSNFSLATELGRAARLHSENKYTSEQAAARLRSVTA